MDDRGQISASAAARETAKFRVFVSYSRDDLDFADQLVTALKLCGFDPTIDRHGISGGEAWQQRLGALILEADTVVFVLSPSSARSEMCGWEVGEASRLGKRILPVLPRPLEGVAAPQKLQDLNYVFFYAEPRSPGSGFGSGLTNLVAALHTDLGWIREHTRLMERATEWETGGRLVSRLLSGSDIPQAKAWAAARPKDAPEPTETQLAFIRASEEEEVSRASTERKRLSDLAAAQDERAKALRSAEQALKEAAIAQRDRIAWQKFVTRGSVAAAAVLAVVAGWALVQRQAAISSQAAAVKSQLEASASAQNAKTSEEKALEQREVAIGNLYESKVTRARALVDKAQSLIESGHHSEAVLLTIEALSIDPKLFDNKYFYIPGANKILAMQALNSQLIGHVNQITSVAVTPDGTRIVTGSFDNTARIWDAGKGTALRTLGHPRPVNCVAVSPADSSRIVTCSGKIAYVWDLKSVAPVAEHLLEPHSGAPSEELTSVAMTPDGARIVTGSNDGIVRVWDIAAGVPVLEFKAGHPGAVTSLVVMPDGNRIVSNSNDNIAHVWDAQSGALLRQLKGHTGAITSVATMPDGKRVVTASLDKTARIWDAQTGNLVQTLEGHSDEIKSLAVMPDGRIVTGSGGGGRYTENYKADFTARIWDAEGHSREIGSHFGPVRALAVMPDGSKIVTGASIDFENTIGPQLLHRAWVWNVEATKPGNLLEHAREGAKMCLNIDERKKLILSPEPPEWCIASHIDPYEDEKWQTPDAYGNFADRALFNGDFPSALKAAELGHLRYPDLQWIEINQAHALMFLGRSEDARALYLKYRGQLITIDFTQRPWEDWIMDDFAKLRSLGLDHGQMKTIEREFESHNARQPPLAKN